MDKSQELIYKELTKPKSNTYVFTNMIETDIRKLEKLLENNKYDENKLKLVLFNDKKKVSKIKKLFNNRKVILAYDNETLKIKEIYTTSRVIIKGNIAKLEDNNRINIVNTYVATTRKNVIRFCKKLYDRFIIIRNNCQEKARIVSTIPDNKILVDASKEVNLMKALNNVHLKRPSLNPLNINFERVVLNFKGDYPQKIKKEDVIIEADNNMVDSIKEVLNSIPKLDINDSEEVIKVSDAIKRKTKNKYASTKKKETKGFINNYVIFVIALASLVIGAMVIIFLI